MNAIVSNKRFVYKSGHLDIYFAWMQHIFTDCFHIFILDTQQAEPRQTEQAIDETSMQSAEPEIGLYQF